MASKIRQFVEYARTLANNVTSSNQINADLLDNKDSTYYAPASHTHSYQAADGDLLAIAGLTGTSGFLKKTAVDTWALDTNTYLTSISSSNVTTALGYTPYNSTNPSGYITSSGSITGSSASCTGNAATATKLTTARTINGTSFDGTANITINTNLGSIGSYIIGRPQNSTAYSVNSTVAGSSLYSTSVIDNYNPMAAKWSYTNQYLLNTGTWRCVSPGISVAGTYGSSGYPGLWVRIS